MPTGPVRTGPQAYRDWREAPLGRITEQCEAAALAPMMGDVAGLDVLDIGCGDGALAVDLARAGGHVVGLDPDPRMLSAARARADAAQLHLDLVDGRIETLPFDSERFDLVTAVTVLCFVRDEALAWREIARVLRPGGRLVIGELGRWNLWAARRRVRGWLGAPLWRGARFHSAGQLCRAAVGAGLRVEEVRGAVFHPPSATLARLVAPLDVWLGQQTTIGAAFIALRASKHGTPR